MKINNELYMIQDNFFNVFITISYILIFVSALVLSQSTPNFLTTLDYYVRIYICLFLIWRFNPFRKIQFTNLDRKICFSAGLFILTTTALNQYLLDFMNKVKNNL